ncbi:hypothetical protein E2320_016138 [Naja naja]|nr:hypothetical protein E2320_016138 [Naja naja]
MPLVRQGHRHHRTHGPKHRKRDRIKESILEEHETYDTPSQRVHFILGMEEDEEHVPHDLFTEMDEICVKDGEESEWKETARWLKFEEDVEDGGERWSKPYVATLSLHSLFELRSCIINGSILLDKSVNCTEDIAEMILDSQDSHDISVRKKFWETLLKKHHHQREKKRNILPIVRSFAESGQRKSDPHSIDKTGVTSLSLHPPSNTLDVRNGLTHDTTPTDVCKADLHFMKKIPVGAEAANVLIGEADFLKQPIVAFIRLSPAVLLPGMTEVFHDVAYKAKDRSDLLAGIDEFLDQVTVLPPGEWDPSIRIEPPKSVPSQNKRKMPGTSKLYNGKLSDDEMEDHMGPELQRTGKLFGGLILDIKRKAPWYWSDYKDALNLQCLASFLFLYCASMSPVITFGGLLGEATDGEISAIESLLGASITGVVYSLFAGQPLTILGSTGPVLVFEKILFKFCKDYKLSYLALRTCIGLWTTFICRCAAPSHPSNDTLMYWNSQNINPSKVVWANLTVSVRSVLSDFAIFITIATMVLIDYCIGIPSPKLNVPGVFKPTRDDRGWLISPIGPNPSWTVLAAIIPALLCTILIFMDQQITAVIVNRKEHKLKKGCGYHLDLLMVGIMLGVCSVMGLPWYVAATVLSISHVNSLRLESTVAAPGEQPKFLGIIEQRATGVMIFVLMGLSVFITSVLKFIPMPVLYGVFLYMGVSSLNGIQFFDRLKLVGMPTKHQPDFIYLRHVPLRKVHLFTMIQLTCLIILWVVKASPAAIIFPMMVLALVFVRKESQNMMEDGTSAVIEMSPMTSNYLTVPENSKNVPKIDIRPDPADINISEEMPKTTVWKTLTMNTEKLGHLGLGLGQGAFAAHEDDSGKSQGVQAKERKYLLQ